MKATVLIFLTFCCSCIYAQRKDIDTSKMIQLSGVVVSEEDLAPMPFITVYDKSIRNLIQTDKGERFFQPEVGCNIRSLLFEPMVETTSIRMKDMIEDTISKFEKRARVLSVEIYPFEARQAYDVFIVFEVINNVNPVTLNLTLYRAR